ncbi:MAG: hypothetical protein GXO07_00245 [Crenarchaeota archaeon]|nr:hypothetical protein [Thermoproteota archaeon]
MMAGARPRYLMEFIKIARNDSKGFSHGDGWGYAVFAGGSLRVKKKLDPIWDSWEPLPRLPFILHARRAKKLPRALDHVHPHLCNGVALAHNGNAEVPQLPGLRLHKRTSSEKMACYFGYLVSSLGLGEAVRAFVRTVRPKPSANFVAIVPSLRKLVIVNYHNGDEYYTLWRKEDLFSSEPLGRGWEPLSLTGEARWAVLELSG